MDDKMKLEKVKEVLSRKMKWDSNWGTTYEERASFSEGLVEEALKVMGEKNKSLFE